MDINQVRAPLTEFLKRISQTVKVDQVIVFGSYARRTATQYSDIDVVVVSDDFAQLRSHKRLRILDQAARFIRPEIVAAGFTHQELEKAKEFSLLGQARQSGFRLI